MLVCLCVSLCVCLCVSVCLCGSRGLCASVTGTVPLSLSQLARTRVRAQFKLALPRSRLHVGRPLHGGQLLTCMVHDRDASARGALHALSPVGRLRLHLRLAHGQGRHALARGHAHALRFRRFDRFRDLFPSRCAVVGLSPNSVAGHGLVAANARCCHRAKVHRVDAAVLVGVP